MKLDLILKGLVENFGWKLAHKILLVEVTEDGETIARANRVVIGQWDVHEMAFFSCSIRDQRPSIDFAVWAP